MTDREFLKSKIGRKLAQLRRTLRQRLAGEGVGWLAMALVALVFVTLGFDFFLHLSLPRRVGVMSVGLLGVLWVVWCQLIAPLIAPMDNEQLALLVEDRYDELSDSLISALQFSRSDAPETPGQSAVMVEKVIAQAGQTAEHLDFQKVVERKRLIRRISLAGCAVAMLACFSVLQAGIMNRWWERNVLFADTPWPQDIYLDVSGPGMDEDGNFRVLRGNDLEIIVTARQGDPDIPTAAPAEITMYATYESVGDTDKILKLNTNGSRTYTTVFSGVSEEIEFYFICSGDKRKIPHRVTLIDPPGISWLQFNIEYPEYMNRPDKPFDASRAVLAAPPGSVITIRASADKLVACDAEKTGLFLDGKKVGSLRQNTAQLPDGSPVDSPSQLIGSFRLPKLPPAQKGVPANPMRTLSISLVDENGFANPRAARYKIRTEPDTAPKISLKRRGVGTAVTPEAILPLSIQAQDDSGISEVRAILSWGGDKPGRKSWIVTPAPEARERYTTLYELDMKDLKLTPGTTISVVVEAGDLMPPELGGPNKGRSGAMTFRIIKRDELLAEMVRRQKALRANFEQTIRKQEDAIATTQAMRDMLAAEQAPADAGRKLRDATSMEIGVGGDCAKTSIAMGDILVEMVYNRIIESKGRTETLNGIVNPLGELGQRVEVLTATMKTAENVSDAKIMTQQAEDIHSEQQSVLEVMREVLERMVKVAEAQELAYKLERLIERWDGVMREASGQADWDIQNALGFKCGECTKPLGPDGGPGASVKCPHCSKTVAKPVLKGSSE
ncbi:MAG: hypothetical protein HN350_09970 [Phycisphaerales bacterium]|jgi:hypothetical protein|nr:hypothetical protein [Phycisphaerales bacterium]